jgi:sugar lactone lactonase YvrE
MTETYVLAEGLGFPESTRWHDGRVWICNWGAGEVLALSADGTPEVIARVAPQTIPFSIEWLPDGELLVVDGPKRQLLKLAHDGVLETLVDLSALSTAPFNELVVSAGGCIYVNGGAGSIVCVRPELAVGEVATGLQWPNGMALLEGERTLIVADSHTRQLVAFDVEEDHGSLSNRRVWADLEHAPDGICADADGAIWVATVPGKRCIRVAEGGQVLDSVQVDRGCFACMLGGEDGRTLFIATAQWRGMEAAMNEGPGLTGRLLAAPGRPAAHAGRP